jgi:hypothetical protein
VPAELEFQFDLGFILHLDGNDSYLGFLSAYFPAIVHELGLGEKSKYPPHNFVVDLFWLNLEDRIIYGLELTSGTNLIDPIGLLHYPGADTSVFLGADAYLGYRIGTKDKRWTPKLRYSILFPDLTVMESQQMEIRLGNEFGFGGSIKLHADFGLGIDTFYSNGDLYTQLSFLWAVNFLVHVKSFSL